MPAIEVREPFRSQAPRACPCRHKIAENAGWDCELLAIELPDLAESPGARRPRHSDHRDGKALCLRRRKRWLITVWLEVRVLPAPPRTPIRTGVSWSLTNSAHFAGVSAGSRTGYASLPPVEVAIASILAPGLWALQTRSWRRSARIKSTNRASRIGATTQQEHRAGE